MKGKSGLIWRVAVALVLALSLGLVIAAPAAANTGPHTYYVNATSGHDTSTTGNVTDPWKTIQHAIDMANAGDIINVAAGTYNENVSVNKSLTLQGASSATVNVTAAVNTDSVFTVTASNVNISGFTATGTIMTGNEGYAGIKFGSGVTNCNIHDNILSNNQYGILLIESLSNTTMGNNTFTNNTASSCVVSGIEMQNTWGNTFTNNIANSTGLDSSSAGQGFRLANSKYNTFTGNTANSTLGTTGGNGACGFFLAKASGTGSNNNTFTNNTANSNANHGIRMDGSTGNTLTGNTFNSNGADGIKLKAGSSNNTLENNTCSNNAIGIEIATTDIDATSLTVTHNNIAGNTNYGVYNGGTGTLDAENNWWDSVNGPTHSGNTFNSGNQGDNVSDLVDYVPWLNAAYPTGTSFAPVNNTTHSTKFSSIQAAIDAASAGDTINVTNGTYVEDLTVNTANLTLQSVGGADTTTIQLVNGVGIDIQGGATNFILGGSSGHGFTVADPSATTFDIQLTNAPSGVNISYNTIDTAIAGATMGISVGAAGATGLVVSYNTFTADGTDGSIWGPDVVNVTVSHNTMTGPSAQPGGGYAVQFAGVTGTSTISNNTITDYGSGVFVLGGGPVAGGTTGVAGLTINDNTITGCTKGIRLGHSTQTSDMTTVSITHNLVSNNAAGVYIDTSTHILADQFTINYNSFVNNSVDTGVDNHNALTVNAMYNWWGDAAGPSIESNPYYSYTEGDSVSSGVTYIPWLIHTELAEDWNIWSVPIAPAANCDTVNEALDLWGADSGKKLIAYYFDSSASPQAWAEADNITPLQAIYVKMSEAGTIDVCFSTNATSPPLKAMKVGWNLVGLAELYPMDAPEALLDAYWGTGVATNLPGYSKAISPSLNGVYWTYLRLADGFAAYMLPTKGYWVFMVNDGVLGGFTSTPITEVPAPG